MTFSKFSMLDSKTLHDKSPKLNKTVTHHLKEWGKDYQAIKWLKLFPNAQTHRATAARGC